MDIKDLDFWEFHNLRKARRLYGRPFVIGHRGASAAAPENTLAAFEAAVEHGAHLIETDLWFSSDREIVLHHDRTLQRTMGRPERVGKLTRQELQACQSIQPYDGEANALRLPSLEQLLEFASNRGVGLVLELKDPLFSLSGYCEVLLRVLKQFDFLHSCFVVSFSKPCLEAFRRLEPGFPLGLISARLGLPDASWSFLGPIYPNLFLNPLYVKLAHRMGAMVVPLDPNPARRAALYNRVGVDAILADNVAELVSVLETT